MPRKNKKLPRHLLVIRTSAMGDVAMLPHALRALKEAYPEVKVTVATKSLFHPFFEGVDVDFLDIETRRTHRGIRGAIRFAREAAELKIDAVADMHNVLRSKMVRAALHLRGIPVSVIHKGRIEKYMRLGRGSEGVKPLKHTVIRYCDVFRRLGFDFPDPRPAEKRPRPNPLGLRPAGQDLSRKVERRSRPSVERAFRPGFRPQRRRRGSRIRPPHGGALSERHGIVWQDKAGG